MKSIILKLKEIPLILWIILLAGFIVRIIFALSLEFSIIHGISSDDSFYYYRIAQNIAHGFGSTFDKITTTNGYQPLVMLPLIFFYSITSISDIFTPIYLSQVFLTIINLFAALLTYFLILKISKGSKIAAILSVCVLYLNPIFMAINFKSLETNLYWFFLVLSLNYYLNNFRKDKISADFVFGLIIAFAALSRLDGGFYILSFAIYILFKKGFSFIEKFKKIFYSGMGFSVIFVPYLLYNHFTFGSIMPISGQAKIYHNHNMVLSKVGSYWSSDFILYELRRFFFPIEFDLLAERGFGPFEQILAVVGIIIFIVFIIYLWKINFLRELFYKFSDLKFFIIFLLIHYGYYTLYFWEYRFYYFVPQILFISILIGIFLGDLLKRFAKDKVNDWNILAKSVFVIIILFNLFIGYRQLQAVHGQTLVYHAGNWIKENIKGDPVMSSANAGIISYYSQKRIINLDGMVNNNELLDAFKKGDESYLEYLKKYKIEYICDYLGVPPTNKYFFPTNLNDKYVVVKEIQDPRLKYQILKDYVILRINL